MDCLETCKAQCGCPIGPNSFACSNHGLCIEGGCVCEGNWINEACDTEIFTLDRIPYIFVLILTSSCILIAVLTSILYFVYRHNQIMICIRPFFGHLMNFGAIVGSIALLIAVHLKVNDTPCNAIWWLLDYSFVFVFGTLLAKTYRNYRILRTTKNESLRLSDGWVVRVILVLLSIETSILLPLYATNHFHDDYPYQEWKQSDGTSERFEGCFMNSSIALIALCPSKVLTILIVFILAFKLRNVKSELNETKALLLSSGITLFIWIFAAFTYLITEYQYGEMFYGCLSVSICVPFITILTTLCIPKVIAIRYDTTRYESRAVVTDWRRNSIVAGPGGGNVDLNDYLANVVWSDVQQVESAEHLIDSIPELILNIDIILLLLSKKVRHRKIRTHAVTAIHQLGAGTIRLYLIQFFQALKYEPDMCALGSSKQMTSPLCQYLIDRAALDLEVAQHLYWATIVELASQEVVMEVVNGVPCRIKKSKRSRPVYEYFLQAFTLALEESTIWTHLTSQKDIVDEIHGGYEKIMQQGTDVKSKTLILRQALSTNGQLAYLFSFPNVVPHPLHSQLMVNGINPENCTIFRSSAKPMKLSFSIDSKAQRQQVQDVMAASLSRKYRSARVSSSFSEISLEFDSTSVESQVTYKVIVDIRSVRHHQPGRKGVHYARVDCNGQMKRTCDASEPKWNETFEITSGVVPHDIEIHIFFQPEEQDAAIFLGEYSVDFQTVMDRHDGKLKGWQSLGQNKKAQVDVSIETMVEEVYDSSLGSGTREGINRAVDTHLESVLNSCNLDAIFKIGDDLRQDQLALQLISIMDSIFLSHQLDLKLTVYRILPTSPTSGFAEFVPDSYAISAVLEANNHSILEFLRRNNFDVHAENNISPAAMETYIRSCAGYCVMTFVLGVGDRHLDNIMLKSTGEVFHIDFGFMFGRDPKPFPPPFRLTPEMVAAMGGMHHKNFEAFMSYAARAFNILRSSSSILLGALELMIGAGIPDMRDNQRAAIAEVEQRLVLHATKYNAAQFMRGMIRHSQKSKTTARLTIMEQFHKFSVALQ